MSLTAFNHTRDILRAAAAAYLSRTVSVFEYAEAKEREKKKSGALCFVCFVVRQKTRRRRDNNPSIKSINPFYDFSQLLVGRVSAAGEGGEDEDEEEEEEAEAN